MTRPGMDCPQWATVDEGWGRKAVDFATLSEPGNCREYVAVHHWLGVDVGDRLLDVACGSGLAIELARLRGASCSGIDASARLVAVARDRNPDSDIRVGDMHAVPWEPASFDVVTSFRGDLGHHTRRGCRDIPGLVPRRTRRGNGVGASESVSWSLGSGAVPPGCNGKGRQPGSDGVARAAWCGGGGPHVPWVR